MIPQLPSTNFDDTVAFYERLGFVELRRWPNEYLILRGPRDGLELHFWYAQSLDPKKNDFSCYIRFDSAAEAQTLHDEWKSVDDGSGGLRPPTDTDYGLREFALIDVDGNLLRLGGFLSTD